MQVLKKHKRPVLLGVFLVAVLIVSFFAVQQIFKPSSNPSSSPVPPTASPVPTRASPTPTGTTTSAEPTYSPPQTSPHPSPSGGLYPGEVTEYQNQALTSISGFAQEIAQHPDVAIEGTQNLNEATYRLKITGLVNDTLEYTYDDVVNNFPSVWQLGTLLCVEGWSVTMLWEGVRVSDLLQGAGLSPSATVAIFYASDGYTTALPLDFMKQNNIILAYKLNNVTLPPFAGFPFCLAAQNQYGYKWIKWITEIEVSNNTGYLGYWESRGYPNNATVNPTDGVFGFVTTAEILIASAVVVIMIVAVYMILVRVRKGTREGQPAQVD